jgi:predicted dehydrogenase
MIGVGLIGTGFMGKCHALAWTTVRTVFGDTPEIRLAHLGEANDQLAAQKGREFGFARASGDWRAVIADPDVHVVSITTPNKFHREMAVAALEAGKHVWCEKPMAAQFADAEAMLAAAKKKPGQVTALGYNYIQSPAIRHIKKLLDEGAIGTVNHVRMEMDEDFLADPDAPFQQRHEAINGYGALDDFGVHPLSLLHVLLGRMKSVICEQAKPHATRNTPQGPRAVEVYDIASALFRLENGVTGVLAIDRAAWGRKGRIQIQIFGSKGSIVFDQERFNEFQLYVTSDRPTEQGFRTILASPVHEPFGRFHPGAGHGMGFNELKTIECRELINRIEGKPAHLVDFAEGIEIERTVHALARSSDEKRWVDVR